ncbi:flagellar hook-basal body complex protein FliE [Ruegeria pomeroyi]|uniref:Flagellar hook-basal body complex protein FliE n=1 Tax=Ruegeria pomeroyi TaxID=89184 RepID=A0A9Q3WQS6_9RHOB|nr:flagellar hook-basal body complex protein FliE [Ruegeria pomeroyi]MCE8539828.1 flagellar hook-basal body complex protein FliE [Ruegeria pomeroyi]
MDIRSLSAAQAYASARPATQADPKDDSAAQGLRGTFQDFAATLQHSEDLAQSAMIGKADPHALVQALAQSELAVETAVTVRNKVVEAYQEILRMPV